jgi:hypothetical protein
MLSTLSFAKRLVNTTHAARRVAARIASEFVPRANLAPITHEALCYACMVGIVMPTHHDSTPWDRAPASADCCHEESSARHAM